MVASKQAAMVPCVRSCDGRSEWACARCGIFASRLHDVAATVLAMGVEAVWRVARRDTIARLLSASVCMGWHEHHLYLHLLSREWSVGGYSGVSFGHSHNACVYVHDEFHEFLCNSQAMILVCVCVQLHIRMDAVTIFLCELLFLDEHSNNVGTCTGAVRTTISSTRCTAQCTALIKTPMTFVALALLRACTRSMPCWYGSCAALRSGLAWRGFFTGGVGTGRFEESLHHI